MTYQLPVEILELRAAEQRRELHGTVEELRGMVQHRLDIKANAREYLAPAAGIMAVMGLSMGYAVAGLFYPKSRVSPL